MSWNIFFKYDKNDKNDKYDKNDKKLQTCQKMSKMKNLKKSHSVKIEYTHTAHLCYVYRYRIRSIQLSHNLWQTKH